MQGDLTGGLLHRSITQVFTQGSLATCCQAYVCQQGVGRQASYWLAASSNPFPSRALLCCFFVCFKAVRVSS